MRTLGRWLWRILLLAFVLVLALQLWYLGWIAWWKWHDPEHTSFMNRELKVLRVKDPKIELKHQWVPYDRISPQLKRAVVAAEDARFSEHEGVDWEAIEKAYETNARRGKPAKGGSTITQQLAKNLFLSPEKNYLRKGEELVITYMLEACWSKRRILEVYLNSVEWGKGVYGAEAAAGYYYRSSAAQLSAEQAARLAAMLPRPKFYDRNRNSTYLQTRAAAIQRYMDQAAVP